LILMKKSVFSFTDYKAYLNDYQASLPRGGHGFRTHLAEALDCRLSYISQVLNSDANFSPEQGESVNRFLKHGGEESDYFLLLILHQRAGSSDLERRLKTQIGDIQKRRQLRRVQVDIKEELSLEDQMIYYSTWIYSAIHILVSLKNFRTSPAISERLRLPIERVQDALEFLMAKNLIVQNGNAFEPGLARIFLKSDSPMINKHHSNWRLRAMDSLSYPTDADVHYSGVLSFSTRDLGRIRDKIFNAIEDVRSTTRDSQPEEELCALCVDFFKI
ncbi:MAG: TIGR02147 family protein, partial [Bdellovibrionales bacterium]